MLSLIRQYNVFGNLGVESNSLCPDWSIYVSRYKNGKCVVKLHSGPCEKPYKTRKFTNVNDGFAWAESFTKNYPKVVVTNFNH